MAFEFSLFFLNLFKKTYKFLLSKISQNAWIEYF